MRSGYDLPPLMFTQDELEAIIVGLALLGRVGDRGLERSADRAASKIAGVIPEGSHRTAPVHVSRWNRIPESNVPTSEFRRFVREAAELRIAYLDLKDRRTIRDIKPVALIYYVDAIILAAWCELRQAFRHFRIDRIGHCTPTGNNFGALSDGLLE